MNQIVNNSSKILEDVKFYLEKISDQEYVNSFETADADKSIGGLTSEILSNFLYFLKGHRKGYMFYRLQQVNPVFKKNRTAALFCTSRIKDEIERTNLYKDIKISFVPKDELASNVTTKASAELEKLNSNFLHLLANLKLMLENKPELQLPENFGRPAGVKFASRKNVG